MVFDSQSANPSSETVGTRPFGFIDRYSGASVPPKDSPASTRS
jgi:hypothetical protein